MLHDLKPSPWTTRTSRVVTRLGLAIFDATQPHDLCVKFVSSTQHRRIYAVFVWRLSTACKTIYLCLRRASPLVVWENEVQGLRYEMQKPAATRRVSKTLLRVVIFCCLSISLSSVLRAEEFASGVTGIQVDYQGACWESSREEPSTCAHTNMFDFRQLDTVSVPDGFYDVSFMAYASGFAERMGMPLGDIRLLDSVQEGLLATGLSVKTIGMKTECRLSLTLSDTDNLQLPDETWFRSRMVRRDLLAVDQRRMNSENFRGADEAEGIFDPYTDRSARSIFAIAGSEDDGTSPDFEVGLYLIGANYGIAPELAHFEFEIPCRPLALSAPSMVEQSEALRIVIQRRTSIDPLKPRVKTAEMDSNYYRTYEIPLTVLDAALPVLEIVAKGDERRMRNGSRGNVIYSEPLSYTIKSRAQ